MNKNNYVRSIRHTLFIAVVVLLFFWISSPAIAQGSLEGRINETINDLVRIINILIVGFVAWAGFLIAKGEDSGVSRLIYGIIGLVVVNTAYLIINYFN